MAASNGSAATDISGLAYNFPRANRYSDVLVDSSAPEAASAIPVTAVSQVRYFCRCSMVSLLLGMCTNAHGRRPRGR